MAIEAGTYKARATKVLLSQVGANKTPAIQVEFRLENGNTIRWDGWLTTDKAQERTIESLEYCGWTGDDLSVFARDNAPLQGLDANDVELVIEMEPSQDDATKLYPRVKWVNRIGGRGLNVENVMPATEAVAFAQKMKGLVLKTRAKQPAAAANGGKAPF
jgi:hypothetical protein